MTDDLTLLSEREAKLQLLMSISKSQDALARILGSLADIAVCSEETALQLAKQAGQLTRYQQAMASMLACIELHRLYIGRPSAPWLNTEQGVLQGIYPENTGGRIAK